ncbi:MAG: hypothetical protein ABI134_25980, partial [Byssovorax sp.]
RAEEDSTRRQSACIDCEIARGIAEKVTLKGLDPDPELVKTYGPFIGDTVLVIGQHIPDSNPSAEYRREYVERGSGDKDSGSPQAYDYNNANESGPWAGYMGIDSNPAVREEQEAEAEKRFALGARGLGEFVLGGVSGNRALATKGLKDYAVAMGVVDPRTVQIIMGAYALLTAGQEPQAPNAAPRTGGRVQSRINLADGTTRSTPLRNSGARVSAGWKHVLEGHFNRPVSNNRSVFTISPTEARALLQSKQVVDSPVSYLAGGQYVRTVDVGRAIGLASNNAGGGSTSVLKVVTDEAGNLITAYPE